MASREGGSGPLGFLRSLYDLDTLDTRFTTPSSVPYRAATAHDKREDDGGDRGATSGNSKRAEAPKWKTPEFYLYYLVFIVVVPYMFWVAYDVSRRRFCPFSERGLTCDTWGEGGVWKQTQERGLTWHSNGSEVQQV